MWVCSPQGHARDHLRLEWSKHHPPNMSSVPPNLISDLQIAEVSSFTPTCSKPTTPQNTQHTLPHTPRLPKQPTLRKWPPYHTHCEQPLLRKLFSLRNQFLGIPIRPEHPPSQVVLGLLVGPTKPEHKVRG